MVYPDYQSVADPDARARFETLWGITDLNPDPGLTVVEIVDAARDGAIRGMYVMGENPAMSDPDQHHARQGLAALDHLVVQEIFLTETAFHADVILPASAWPEKTGTVTNTNRQVQMGRPAFDPPGEARADWEIIQELANRLDLGWNYDGPHEVYEELRASMNSIDGISWERLEREDAVIYPCDEEDGPGTEIMFAAGFPTKSGAASSCRPNWSRRMNCRMTTTRWFSRRGGCSNTGTPEPSPTRDRPRRPGTGGRCVTAPARDEAPRCLAR